MENIMANPHLLDMDLSAYQQKRQNNASEIPWDIQKWRKDTHYRKVGDSFFTLSRIFMAAN